MKNHTSVYIHINDLNDVRIEGNGESWGFIAVAPSVSIHTHSEITIPQFVEHLSKLLAKKEEK